jgi:hypothetical protein
MNETDALALDEVYFGLLDIKEAVDIAVEKITPLVMANDANGHVPLHRRETATA